MNAYVCSLDRTITAYQSRACYSFLANAANTGAATLNLNGLGATPLKKFQGGVLADLLANDIITGQIVQVCYDGTVMQMVSPSATDCGMVQPAVSPNGVCYYPAAGSIVDDSTGMRLDSSSLLTLNARTTTMVTNETLDTGDGPIIACTTGGTSRTATLPSVATTTQGWFRLVKVDSAAGACVLAPNGSETLNGVNASLSATTQWSYVEVWRHSTTNWHAQVGITPNTVAYVDTANTWTPGIKQTFAPLLTGTPGLNVGSVAGDPTTLANGDLWYDSTAQELTARINGANVPLGAGGPGGVLNASAERITTVAASKTLDSSDGPIVACTGGSSDVTLTLPTGATADAQRHWTVLKVDAGSGKCLVARNGSDTINGAATTQEAPIQWSRVDLDLAATVPPASVRNWSAMVTSAQAFTVAEGGTGFTDTTYSGTTHKLVTMGAGNPATDDCAKWDANDNLVSAGACGGAGVTTGDKTDITVSTTTLPADTWTIDPGAVTYAKMQNTGASSVLLGRGDTGTGPPQEVALGAGLAFTPGTNILNATAAATLSASNDVSDVSVTTATNPNTETQLKQLTIPAGALNVANLKTEYLGFGRYTTGGSVPPLLRFRLYLCTVSGCGSGTVLTLADFTTAVTTISVTNSWLIQATMGTAATGATGTIESRITLFTQLGAAGNLGPEFRMDQNNAVSAAINLTGQLFLRLTILNSTNLAGHTVSQRQATLSFPSSVSPDSATVLTNKTYDAEATGNVFTSTHKIYLEAASCQGTTASLLWDVQATGAPTAACIAGTNRVRAVADFNDAADNAMHRYIALPGDFTGAVDARVFWFAAAITGTVRFGVRIDCYAAGEDTDGAVTNSTTFAATPNGTANRLVITAQTAISTTGCAAGELARVDFFRDGDGTSGTDSMTGNARLVGLELTLRRTQ